MKTSPLSSLLLLAIWPTTVVVQAFASSTTTSLLSQHGKNKKSSLPSPPKSFVQKHQSHHNHKTNHLYKTASSSSQLNLFGSNQAAGAAAAAVTNLIPRGGGIANTVSSWASTPNGSFNLALGVLAASTAILKVYNRVDSDKDNDGAAVKKDPKVKALQTRFLMVFWLLRMADWLQGPYFYQVYASKTFGAATGNAMTWVSRLFLTGFASTALFGPLVGRLCDTYGRKAGTLVFSLLYSLGAMSTKSNVLGVLLAGRVMGGIGTSLLFSAPEAWLVGDAARTGVESSLGETFGLAYAGDSIVAILAGQMAGMAAGSRGPSGPFELSVGFLILGGLLASFMWKENVAGGANDGDEEKGGDDDSGSSSKPTIRDAVKVVKEDPKIMLVGSIQSLFEAAMYVFVLNWPPAVSKAVSAYFSKFAADSSAAISTPYGTVFSCFMACCLLGSTIFGQLTSSTKVDKNGKSKAISTENFAAGMLGLATLAMGCATVSISTSTPRIFTALTSLPVLSTILSPLTVLAGSLSSLFSTPGSLLGILILSLFIFESCVGMYFPTIGTLRSKYFPDSHRSVVMNLFGIPLNAMVVTVFLSIEKLGVQGALGVSTTALALATACGLKLKGMVKKEEA